MGKGRERRKRKEKKAKRREQFEVLYSSAGSRPKIDYLSKFKEALAAQGGRRGQDQEEYEDD